MAVIGILFLMLCAASISAWGTWDYLQANKSERERALQKQVHALKATLEITQQAWAARAAMHTEADRIRHQLREQQ